MLHPSPLIPFLRWPAVVGAPVDGPHGADSADSHRRLWVMAPPEQSDGTSGRLTFRLVGSNVPFAKTPGSTAMTPRVPQWLSLWRTAAAARRRVAGRGGRSQWILAKPISGSAVSVLNTTWRHEASWLSVGVVTGCGGAGGSTHGTVKHTTENKHPPPAKSCKEAAAFRLHGS